jgi:hypothetical protein
MQRSDKSVQHSQALPADEVSADCGKTFQLPEDKTIRIIYLKRGKKEKTLKQEASEKPEARYLEEAKLPRSKGGKR